MLSAHLPQSTAPSRTPRLTALGENTNTQSRNYLRRTLWRLQQTLEARTNAQQPLLLVDSDSIQLNAQATLWLDVAELERVYQLVKGVPGETLDRQTAQLVHDTAALYRGELLLGWYQPWCIYERERLQHIYLIMLDKLMRHSEMHGKLEAGIAYGRRILRCDRAREYTHRQLMRLLYLARDRSGALRQYAYCVTALREELDIEPTQRTQQLYEQIRQDKVQLSTFAARDSHLLEPTERAMLVHIKTELAQIQSELERLNQHVVHTTEIVTTLLQ